MDTSCLVPLFDMLNNDPGVCNNYTYNRRETQFEIVCRSEIEANSQVFINYGSYGMLDILQDYGYLYEAADLELQVSFQFCSYGYF